MSIFNIDFDKILGSFSYDPSSPMIFSSGFFLWIFAAFLLVYSLLKKQDTLRIIFVTAFSYYFYYKSSGTYFFLLALVTVSDFYFARMMHQTNDYKIKKRLVISSLCINLGLLAYFKYTNFFAGFFVSLWGGEFDGFDIFLPV
ncbi:MAG: MBOAT family protein, partial [Bacteroides sp.]|nr:MBOAT family protein [Bacteroides sp.]